MDKDTALERLRAAGLQIESVDRNLLAKVLDFARRLTKDSFRFAVGIPGGHHSTVWSAWGNKNDYYLGARSFLGSQRISLHKSLRCRMAFTEKHMEALRQQ